MKRTFGSTAVRCLWVAVSIAGCGYSFAERSDAFPNDIRTVYIEPFINQTRTVGLEKELTSALRSEFYRRGQLRVVDSVDQADGIVAGVVRSFDSHVASANRKDEVLQYETAMIVDASLRRREPNEIIWRSQGTRLTNLHGGFPAGGVSTALGIKKR